MANTYLTRTQSSTGSETTGTFSAWVKRTGLSTASNMYTSYQANNEFCDIQFNGSDQLQVVVKIGGTDYLDLRTTRLFRDTSSFYHVVVAFDSTDSTQADRCKIYVNGTRETSFATNTNNVSSSLNMRINGSSQDPYIGSWHNQGNYFSGVMSHVYWVDGTAYTPSTFGQTDSTTGQWEIKTDVTASYGTNGFFILKDGNSVTDQSGNGNNFTVGGGTLTNTEDNPSNVFATYNSLAPTAAAQTMQNGNTYLPGPNSNNYWQSVPATIGVSSGKFYCEFKDENAWGTTSDSTRRYGICNLDNVVSTLSSGADVRFSDTVNGYAYMNASGVRYNNGTISGTTSTYPTFSPTDIIQIAMDLDNNKLFFGKNGTWLDSSDPAAGTNPVATIADGTWTFYAEIKYGSDNVSANFGNGYYRTTAISSEGTNASGIGKFEYDVPAGYAGLSTKGLNL